MKFCQLQQMYKLKSNKQAFSLIELCIVLAIIIIMTTLAITFFVNQKEPYLIAEAYTLRTRLWQLQQEARVENKQKSLIFNESNSSYSFGNENHKLSKYVKFGTLRNILGPPSSPKKLLRKAITFKSKKITITPQGILQSGTVYLIDDAGQLLYAVTVPISGISYIRIYRYRNKQWHVYT